MLAKPLISIGDGCRTMWLCGTKGRCSLWRRSLSYTFGTAVLEAYNSPVDSNLRRGCTQGNLSFYYAPFRRRWGGSIVEFHIVVPLWLTNISAETLDSFAPRRGNLRKRCGRVLAIRQLTADWCRHFARCQGGSR